MHYSGSLSLLINNWEINMPNTCVNRARSACVYTTLIGGYEKLKEQPIALTSRVPFICLTDDPDLRSETWQVQHVPTLFSMDPIRSQRALKLRPHEYLPNFDCSLYIDNTVLLTRPPEELIEEHLSTSGFCLPKHSYRDTVLDEFLVVARTGLDDQNRIFEQLNHYSIEVPEVLQEKPYWSGILLRDHRNPIVRTMLEVWLAHVLRYSRRDQLSVNLAFRCAGLKPATLCIDNFASWFHSWPHFVKGDRQKGARRTMTSLSPGGARIRDLDQQNEALRSYQKALAVEIDSLRAELSRSKNAFGSRLGRFLRRIISWNKYDAAYQIWKEYKKKRISRHAALKAIKDNYGVTSFFLFYPLYKTVKPFAKTVKWYRKAAQHGYASGQYKLGLMYYHGEGVPQDDVKAHMWFNLAAAQGNSAAKKLRDELAGRMTPAQIVEVQNVTKERKPKGQH